MPFRSRLATTAHQWLIVCNGLANQITVFALEHSRILPPAVRW